MPRPLNRDRRSLTTAVTIREIRVSEIGSPRSAPNHASGGTIEARSYSA